MCASATYTEGIDPTKITVSFECLAQRLKSIIYRRDKINTICLRDLIGSAGAVAVMTAIIQNNPIDCDKIAQAVATALQPRAVIPFEILSYVHDASPEVTGAFRMAIMTSEEWYAQYYKAREGWAWTTKNYMRPAE